MNGNNKKYKDGLFLLILLFAVLFFFKDALLGKHTLIFDSANFFYPLFFSVSNALRQWTMPLWNPFLFNGFPTIANIESQLFYPINLLFLPFTAFTPYAVHLSLILHCFLAGLFMYLLCAKYLQNRWACFLSAMVYMLSGFTIGHFQHVTMIEVFAWLPLVFLFYEKALMEQKQKNAVFAGFFFGLSILAGHPQTSHGMAFAVVIHTAYRTATMYMTERKWTILRTHATALILFLAVGSIIAAVQILPTYEFITQATRGNTLSFDFAAKSGQLSLRDLILIIVPNYFGALTDPFWGGADISQSILYIGVLPLFLIGLALIFDRKKRNIVYFIMMAIFFLLVSLGQNGPVYRLLFEYVPGFNYFRSPQHLSFLFSFFSALAAAYGFNVLLGNVKKSSFYIYLTIFLLLSILLYFISPVFPEAGAAYRIHSDISSSAGYSSIPSLAKSNMQTGFAGFISMFILSAVLVALALFHPRDKKIYLAILLFVTFVDLYLHLSDAITVAAKSPPSVYQGETALITEIKNHAGVRSSAQEDLALNDSELNQGLFRIYTIPDGIDGLWQLGSNRAMLAKTFLVSGFDPLELSRHQKLVKFLSSKNIDNLYKITNVKYIYTEGQNHFDYYPNYLPRAYVVANAEFLEDDNKALEKLAVFDPSSKVIINGSGITNQIMNAGEWTASFEKYASTEAVVKTFSQNDGFLVLSDTYYPGWRAWIDGVERPVLRANYNFRALSLPKGEHTVVFKFKPRSLNIGLFISLTGCLLVGLYFFYPRWFIPYASRK